MQNSKTLALIMDMQEKKLSQIGLQYETWCIFETDFNYYFFSSKREVRMWKREENRGDGFPDTDLDDSDIKEEEDQEAMDTTESGANAPNAANATDSGVSAPKDEIKDEIKEEKPDTDELDKEAGTPSQPNKVNLMINYQMS